MTEAKVTEIAVKQGGKSADRSVFIAVPNMLDVNSLLVGHVMNWFGEKRNQLWFYMVAEQRHHDHARNILVEKFLETEAEWILFLDSDVSPNVNLLDMTGHGKLIIGGVVFAWIKGRLFPSVWQLAPCEECRNFKLFSKEKRLHDDKMFKIGDFGELIRWSPIFGTWHVAAKAGGVRLRPCRCAGSKMDPWVFQVDEQIYGDGEASIFRTNSIGTAALMIHRSVFDRLYKPWFSFLYREDRKICLTEDHFFCWNARLLGIEIWCDRSMACGHFKTVDLLAVNNSLVEAYRRGIEETRPATIVRPSTEEIAAHDK